MELVNNGELLGLLSLVVVVAALLGGFKKEQIVELLYNLNLVSRPKRKPGQVGLDRGTFHNHHERMDFLDEYFLKEYELLLKMLKPGQMIVLYNKHDKSYLDQLGSFTHGRLFNVVERVEWDFPCTRLTSRASDEADMFFKSIDNSYEPGVYERVRWLFIAARIHSNLVFR